MVASGGLTEYGVQSESISGGANQALDFSFAPLSSVKVNSEAKVGPVSGEHVSMTMTCLVGFVLIGLLAGACSCSGDSSLPSPAASLDELLSMTAGFCNHAL